MSAGELLFGGLLAVNAAAFLKTKQPGLYTMKELVAEK